MWSNLYKKPNYVTNILVTSLHCKNTEMEGVPVIIVGAGPAGLATAASLTALSIPSLILERDDCVAPLWRKRTYDRLHLHLAKKFCELPHFPHSPTTPTFIPKDDFLEYLDDYAVKFDMKIHLRREVKSATCLLYTSPSPRDRQKSRMPSSA